MNKPLSPKAISEIIEQEIGKIDFPNTPERLYEPMSYIIALGGKRLRPLLALMSYNLFSDDLEKAVAPSLCIELFHNFSLIHDDIMDNAPVRRGKATVHEKWNSNVAILSGDGMLVKAYELLESVEGTHLPGILKAFNKTALEVCEGQQLDMDFELRSLRENAVTEQEYLNMIRLKTSVLFGFSLQLGGQLAGAAESVCANLYEAGVHLGLAFQLQDDLLDLYGGEKFGKIPGGDIINAKKTFLLVKTMELADKADHDLLVNILKESERTNPQRVQVVGELYAKYKIPALVQMEIEQHLNNFKDTMHEIGSERADGMISFVDNLAHRTT